jgi:hypothetical protein
MVIVSFGGAVESNQFVFADAASADIGTQI